MTAKDAGDVLAAGGRLALEDSEPIELPAERAHMPKAVSVEDFLALRIPEPEWLLEPLFRSKGLGLVYARRGAGKTWFSISAALAVASGTSFLKWNAPRPRRVLLVDGEMEGAELQSRMRALVAGSTTAPPEGHLRILAADLHADGFPSLDTPEGRAAIEANLEGIELLVLDNLSALAAMAGNGNDAEDWETMQAWLLSLRRRGIAVLVVHHAGKGGDQRGTSKREDVLNLSLELRVPEDDDGADGCRVEVRFSKARGLRGPQREAFEATLVSEGGGARWSWRNLRDETTARILELEEQGKSVRAIAHEVGLDPSRVSRRLRKAREAGAVPPKDATP